MLGAGSSRTQDARTLDQWFAASVAAYGNRTAVELPTGPVTYRGLDAAAGALAAQVAEHAGQSPIGLLAARSLTAYAGYLAVQRLGRAVVPLSTTAPAARTAAVLRSGGIDLVIADAEVAADLPVPVVRPASEPPAAGAPSLHLAAVDPETVAYVLFTSGSTGRPKGVPISHRNIDAYLRHVIGRYGLGPDCRVSQNFDLTFDLSVFDLFAAWGSGATVVVPDHADLADPAGFVARRRLTHWFSVPSAVSFARRLDALPAGGMPSLRWSLFCGEPLTTEQAAAWQAAAPGSTVENLYGPTELTLSCTQYRLPADPAGWPRPANGTVPIGTPYPGVEVLVLDADGRPAEEGELCVTGVQRFAGYLDPEDDRGRFVRFDGRRAFLHGGPERPGPDLWYRTGDRVRRDGEHGLVHLGRLDHQVKISGYRVELGEIEAALRDRAGVQEAVVVAVPGPDGEPSALAAAYTGSPWSPRELRAALRGQLPDYMIPAEFTALDAFPLTPTGKVDRLAVSALVAG